MRNYRSSILFMFMAVSLSGCGVVPSFPDLWPFNDAPGGAQASGQNPVIAPAAQSAPAAPGQVAAAPAPAAPAAAAPAPAPTQLSQAVLPPVPEPVVLQGGGITASPAGAVVYIISPADGAVVTNPVRVVFGLDRMGIAPVSSTEPNTGHHHLLINTPVPADLDRPIPVDQSHRHFSGGQTEATINLPVGQNTLQLMLGDHNHTPHNPAVVSRPITITVQ